MSDAPPVGVPPWRDLPRRALDMLRSGGIRGTLARGSALSFSVNVLGTLVSFVVQILLARTLGVSHYGTYVYALGWTYIALVVAKFDFDNAAVRFVGAYVGRGSWALLRGFIQRAHQIVAVASLTVAVLAAGALWLFRHRIGSTELLVSYMLACLIVPASGLLQLRVGALQGLKRVVASQAPMLLLRPLLLGVAVVATRLLLGRTVTASMAIALNVATLLAVLIVSGQLLGRALPAEARSIPPEYATREWVSVAATLVVISAAQVILSQASDVVLAGLLVGRTAAAHYGVASQLCSLVIFGSTAVTFIATPTIAELHAQGRPDALRSVVRVVARANLLVSLPVVIGLALLGRWLLGLYGPSFPDAYRVLLILVAAQFVVASVGGLAGFLMIMTEHQRAAAQIIAGSAALNIAAALLLTQRFGLVGTASATLLATVVRSVVLSAYIWRKLHINPLPTFRWT